MRRVFNLLAALLIVALGGLVYRAKLEARDALDRVESLTVELDRERGALAVLRAEIAHLEDPKRLRRLAFRHLGLVPVDPLRVVTLEEAPLLFEAGWDWAAPAFDVVQAASAGSGADVAAAGYGADDGPDAPEGGEQ